MPWPIWPLQLHPGLGPRTWLDGRPMDGSPPSDSAMQHKVAVPVVRFRTWQSGVGAIPITIIKLKKGRETLVASGR
jgi:hypothetical protein